jgi:integration host factor subunit beta
MRNAIGIIRKSVLSDKLFDSIQSLAYTMHGKIRISFEGKLMATITKKELVDKIAEKTGVTQSTVKTIVQRFLYEITSEVAKSNRLEFRDFGIFEVKERAARISKNPKTLEPVEVPAKRTVKFRMGRLMREGMNSKSAKKP